MYDLVWSAVLEDGSVINQYDETGKEVLFKEVLEVQDRLINFALYNKNLNVAYVVDLKHGCIHFTMPGIPFVGAREDMLRNDDEQYRLIYFREVERTFGSNLEEIDSAKIIFFLGFQYTDKNGRNHKRMIRIHPDGRWTIN